MGKHMDHCTGTLDVDDEKDAKDYMKDTHCPEVSHKETTLSFMLERGWITHEEYNSSLSSAKPKKVEVKAPKMKVTSWDEQYLKRVVIPQRVKGCTIQHVNKYATQAWTGKYPGATPFGSRTRSYDDTDAKSSNAMARHCVEWLWQEHRKATGAECHWDLGDYL